MPFIAVNNRTALSNGKVGTFTMRFRHSGAAPTPGELAAMSDAAATAWNDHLDLFCPDIIGANVVSFGYTRVVPTPPKVPYFAKSTPELENLIAIGPFTHAGESLPPNNALVVSLKSSGVGRRGRGRLYTPQPPETEFGPDGILSGTHDVRQLIIDIRDNVEALAAPADLELVVHSATYDEANGVIAIAQGGRIDTQRRRLARRG